MPAKTRMPFLAVLLGGAGVVVAGLAAGPAAGWRRRAAMRR